MVVKAFITWDFCPRFVHLYKNIYSTQRKKKAFSVFTWHRLAPSGRLQRQSAPALPCTSLPSKNLCCIPYKPLLITRYPIRYIYVLCATFDCRHRSWLFAELWKRSGMDASIVVVQHCPEGVGVFRTSKGPWPHLEVLLSLVLCGMVCILLFKHRVKWICGLYTGCSMMIYVYSLV